MVRGVPQSELPAGVKILYRKLRTQPALQSPGLKNDGNGGSVGIPDGVNAPKQRMKMKKHDAGNGGKLKPSVSAAPEPDGIAATHRFNRHHIDASSWHVKAAFEEIFRDIPELAENNYLAELYNDFIAAEDRDWRAPRFTCAHMKKPDEFRRQIK